MQPDAPDVKSLFHQALEIESLADRRDWLEKVCGDWPDLLQQVTGLLESHAAAGDFLDETIAATMPPTETPADETPRLSDRYRAIGEIGRGGMGAVWSVVDEQFERPLAVKVMLPQHAADAEARERFEREAMLTGALQHPAIPPVVDRGVLDDGKPFFSMKLVEGNTLADLLSRRSNPTDELLQLLNIFEQVCHAAGYAHSQGIIHRDLKPANVMVGAFGEVQLMDWGMARPVWLDDISAESPAPVSVEDHFPKGKVETVKFGQPDSVTDERITRAGTVMGTLAYMPPEQARGEVDRLDSRSDVFSLGAILCEILTGQRVYQGADIWRQVAETDTDAAIARLKSADVDAELAELCRRCLSRKVADRPSDGAAVADAIRAYRQSIQTRLEQERTERAAAEVRAAEERKRRRVLLGLAAAVMLLVAGVAGAGLWYQNHRAERRAERAAQQRKRDSRQQRIVAEVRAALDESDRSIRQLDKLLRGEQTATELLSALDRWRSLVESTTEAVTRADKVARADFDLLPDADRDRLAEMRRLAQRNAREFEIARRLDEIRLETLEPGLRSAFARAARKYGGVFQQQGLLPKYARDIHRVAAAIRRSRIRFVLIAALDHWAYAEMMDILRTGKLRETIGRAERLLSVARAVDNDPWRTKVRNIALWVADKPALVDLAGQADIAKHSPQLLDVFSFLLPKEEELKFRRRVSLYYPSDFHLAFGMAMALDPSPARESWMQHALTIRPENALVWNNLGYSLAERNLPAQACIAYRKSLKFNPHYALALGNLGNAQAVLGRHKEAIQSHRLALTLLKDPKHRPAFLTNLAGSLILDRQFDEALGILKKAVALDPGFAKAHAHIGRIHLARKNDSAAIEALERATRLISKKGDSLAKALVLAGSESMSLGEHDRAVSFLQRAVRTDPTNASAFLQLGVALGASKRKREALEQFRQAVRLDPNLLEARLKTGTLLADMNDLKAAIAEFRAAVVAARASAEARYSLAHVLQQDGRTQESLAQYRAAVRLDPMHGRAHFNLGTLLLNQNKPGEAAPPLRRAAELLSDELRPLQNLGKALALAGRHKEAEQIKRKALKMQRKPQTLAALAVTLMKQGRLVEAEKQYRNALGLDDGYAIARRGLAIALARQKKLAEALKEFRKLLECEPEDGSAYRAIGNIELKLGRRNEAVKAYRRAIELDDTDNTSRHGLAQTLIKRRSPAAQEEAFSLYRQIIKRNEKDIVALTNAAVHHNRRGESRAAERLLRKVLAIDGTNWPAISNLGLMLERDRRYKDAIRLYRKAVAKYPRQGTVHWWLGMALKKDRQLSAAHVAIRTAQKLLPGNKALASDLRTIERWVQFDRDSAAIIAGTKRLGAARDYLEFAEFLALHHRKLQAAFRAYETGLADAQSLADAILNRHLYNAACCAAITAAGSSKAVPALSEREKVNRRQYAFKWLRLRLSLLLKNKEARDLSFKDRRTLRHWRSDPDLASVRGPEIRGIPVGERAAWRKLWAKVAATLRSVPVVAPKPHFSVTR